MELERPVKLGWNELRSAVSPHVKIPANTITWRRAGNQITRLSLALYVLGASAAMEAAPFCWIVAGLLGSAKRRLLDMPEASRHAIMAIGRPTPATAKENLAARVLPPISGAKNESFRNVWTPPATGSTFKRRRLLWMSHGNAK